MADFTLTKEHRLIKLKQVSKLLLETGNAHSFIIENKEFIPTVIPTDFIRLFDEIIKDGHKMDDIKVLTNKVLNIFHIPIKEYRRIEPKTDSFLGVMEQNNREMALLLDKIRPVYKAFVKNIDNVGFRNELAKLFRQLELFLKHYTIKENVLFPIIEETWPDYRCLQIMWSFHDDIRRNIKTVIAQLSEDDFDFKQFNKCVGDIFFNMLAIKFREERILYPYILSTISESQLETMNREGFELGYPYIQASLSTAREVKTGFERDLVNLGTGTVSVEQIKLIFNHLPVDITFVDKNNRVCYFSTPKKQIFPRTTAIIGREVSNCHPPESVHVVEKIIESFRNGEKDHADFWIRMKGEYILIQYFAVRNEQGNYKGVLEVSQEISDIKALEGEKRLLDW
ncbi:MAG: PAS domain-containing protein [Bacteroidales bacterium]|nr:PAS domain-containing protein [Bacteroidales bacterium]